MVRFATATGAGGLDPFGLERPLSLRADVVVHSTTTFLNGHFDSIGGGAVCKSADDVKWLKYAQNAQGATDGLTRISVGIEDLSDIVKDPETALAAV